MNQEELQRLSVAELIDKVLHLQNENRQLEAELSTRSSDPFSEDMKQQDEAGAYAALDREGHASEDPPADLDEQLQRTSLLLQLSIEFRETLEPSVIVERMLHVMVSNLGITNASVVLIGLDGSVELAMSLRDGKVQQVTAMITRTILDRGLAGWVLRHGRSVVLPDVARDKRWIPYSGWQKVGSAIVLPIRQAQTTLGVMTIFHPEPNHFASRDMLLMEGVAAQAGVAIGASRRYLEESRRREQALALFAMSQFLTSQRSYDDLAAMLHEKSVSIFGVDYGLLFLRKNGESAAPFSSLSPVSLPPAMLQAGHKPLLRQATMTVRKACEQKSIVTDTDSPELPTRTVMAVPLVHTGSVLGAVALVRVSGSELTFSANLWSMLTTFTNVIAATCASMQMMKQLEGYTEQLESLVQERTRLLRNSRDLLRVVFDNLPEGLVLLDPQEVVLAANNAFCYPVVGRHPRMIVGQDMSGVWEELEQRSELQIEMHANPNVTGITAKDSGTMRVHCTTSIGQKRWYEISRLSVADDDGDIEYYIERWLDITRQQEMERHLLAQDQRNILGHLTARVVHDINAPLQDIEGRLAASTDESFDLPAAVQEHLLIAQGSLNRIDRTLKNLSHLYQSPKTSWECVDINCLLRELEEFTVQQFTHYGVTIRFELDEEIPLMYAQPDALRQVFLGLLFNAQEAMDQGGEIVVTSRWDKGEQGSLSPLCRISIQDTGVGMTTEEVMRLFEPFKSKKEQGVGMGLYLSKQIIEQHTGRIEVTSEKHEGTVVDVFLPWDERCRGMQKEKDG